MTSESRKTIPARRKPKRSVRRNPGVYMLTRKNCFGIVEKLDPLSVEKALEGEDKLNDELESFLNDVAKSGTTRTMKAVTKEQIDERAKEIALAEADDLSRRLTPARGFKKVKVDEPKTS